MSKNGKWLLSLNKEDWKDYVIGEFNTFDLAKEYLDLITVSEFNNYLEKITGVKLEKEESITVYIGRVEDYIPSINVDEVLSNLNEQAYSEVGEVASDYLTDLTNKQENELDDELNKVLVKWLDKHNLNPKFYSIVDIKEVTKIL